VKRSLILVNGYVDEEVILVDAAIRSLWFCWSRLERGMNGNLLKCSGSIILRESEARSEVNLANADIKGNLNCAGLRIRGCPDFERLDQVWLQASDEQRADWLTVVPENMKRFASRTGERPGEEFLVVLDQIISPFALNAECIKVEGNVLLRQGFTAKGEFASLAPISVAPLSAMPADLRRSRRLETAMPYPWIVSRWEVVSFWRTRSPRGKCG
jgi:hypothetical protein